MELNLTPSAVSHSMRKMEETLGVVLFEAGSSLRRAHLKVEELMGRLGVGLPGHD